MKKKKENIAKQKEKKRKTEAISKKDN